MLKLAAAAAGLAAMAFSTAAEAGDLRIVSWSVEQVDCSYGSGSYPNNQIASMTISYGAPWVYSPPADGSIDWLACGTHGAVSRHMNITPDGDDHTIVLTSNPERALNVLLYPYLPSDPNGNFAWMQALVAMDYATYGDPSIMLNVVITGDEDYDIYTASNYPTLYGETGFDVVEADMIMLPQILAGDYIRALSEFDSDAFWPAAVEAVTSGGEVWAQPHWMCSDYLFGRDPAIQSITTFAELQSYLAAQPDTTPAMIGNFNGHWRLVGLYFDAYADLYGFENISGAFTMPPDPTAINNIAVLTQFCDFNGENKCTDDFYHDRADGSIAAVFATGGAATYVGFSEQSFYILLNETDRTAPLYATEVSYGTMQTPMLYVDAFTVNAASCPAASACDGDAQSFFERIDANPDFNMTAYSWDLSGNAPPRRLLVASKAFWNQDFVQSDPLYSQFLDQVDGAHAFPNTITAADQQTIYDGVCSALKAVEPDYVC